MPSLKSLLLLACGLLSSCVTSSWNDPIAVLNRISDLFDKGRYEETIEVASKARDKFRYKTYSFSKEAAEIFLAEGAVTDYVLESYERGYLSFLIAVSYLKLNQADAASVELHKFYNEEVESLYNHGQDPVNALLQAALWDNNPREGFSSRPFWFWLSKAETSDGGLRDFARKRVKEIDSRNLKANWEIAGAGTFPKIDWGMKFNSSQSGYFSVRPAPPFVKTCSDAASLLVPTSSWFHKIAIRHNHGYHPLVNVKSWIRLPFGITYGITTLAAGAGIVVGGCALDLAGKGEGHLCSLSIQGGAAIMASTDDVVDYALRPDLRHWEKVPAAIFLRRKNQTPAGVCDQQANEMGLKPIL